MWWRKSDVLKTGTTIGEQPCCFFGRINSLCNFVSPLSLCGKRPLPKTQPQGHEVPQRNTGENPRRHSMKTQSRVPVVIAACIALFASAVVLVNSNQSPEPLTGNWVVRAPTTNHDGTFRTTYLNLKQEGQKITGTIRVTQFFYHITESTGGPDGFTLTGSMMDGTTERTVQYGGKLAGAGQGNWAGALRHDPPARDP